MSVATASKTGNRLIKLVPHLSLGMSLEFMKAMGHIDGEHRISLVQLSIPWFQQSVEVVQPFSPTYIANMASMRELVRGMIELTVGQEEVSLLLFCAYTTANQSFWRCAALVRLVGTALARLVSCIRRYYGCDPWRDLRGRTGFRDGEECLERTTSRITIICCQRSDSEVSIASPQDESELVPV